MSEDYRMKCSYIRHHKTRMLKNELGAEGVLCHLTLISYCAEHRYDGDLSNMSDKMIEGAAEWTGQPGVFVTALLDCGLLDRDENGTRMHDWEDHQPYIVTKPKRIAQARRAAKARWGDEDSCLSHTGGIQRACSGHADSKMSNAPSPIPSPSPDPIPKREESDRDILKMLVTEYHKHCPDMPGVKKIDPQDRRARFALSRYRENKTQDWSEFFRIAGESSFLNGRVESRNGKSPFVADFEWLMRPSNFVKVIEGVYNDREVKRGGKGPSSAVPY